MKVSKLERKCKVLDKVINKWLKLTFKDKYLRYEVKRLMRDNCYVAGGSISSIAHKYDINDIDIYFTNTKSLLRFMELIGVEKEYTDIYELIDIFKEKGYHSGELHTLDELNYNRLLVNKNESFLEKQVYSNRLIIYHWENRSNYHINSNIIYNEITMTNNAITIINDKLKLKGKPIKVQFIVKYEGKPLQTISNRFDFSHNMIAYILKDKCILSRNCDFTNMINKRLAYYGNGTPLSSLNRALKYKYKYGYHLPYTTYHCIINDMDEKYGMSDEYVFTIDRYSYSSK